MPRFEVREEDLAREPVKLVHFSHGQLKQGNSSKLRWSVWREKVARKNQGSSKRTRSKTKVTAEANGRTYTAQNFGPTADTDPCDYYLAVLDRDSGKMRVIPAEKFRMEPWFEEKREEEGINAQSLREKKSSLAKDFGSGKMQRSIRQSENNRLDEDMVAATVQKVADKSAASLAEKGASTPGTPESSQMSAIPPHDPDAKTPQEVYKLKDILKDDLLPYLAEECKVFVDSTRDIIDVWRAQKTYPVFVLDKLETLAVREDARLFQSQCLMFLCLLMKLYTLKYTEVRKKFPLPKEWPEPIKLYLLSTFTFEVKSPRYNRSMPSRLKDLLLSHILVLCLKLTNHSLQLNMLLGDLNMAQKKLNTHASALGCTVRSYKDPQNKSSPPVYTAELKVPLKFPEMRGKSNMKRLF